MASTSTRITIAQRAAIRAALPFQSEYPSCALGDARTRYVEARRKELTKLREARAILAAHPSDGMRKGWCGQMIHDTRRYLANMRAARSALRALEA